MNIDVNPNWWKTLFDEVYLLTDARSVCDAEITRREVEVIFDMLPLRPDQKILDLCGGHGRHSLELCMRGFTDCTSLDYSQTLIQRAKARATECNLPIDFICSDARDTCLLTDSFDHVLLMGNSLGYIRLPEADRQILAEACRVLRPNGWLLVDVANGEAVKKSFTASSWHEIGSDIVVCRQRELKGEIVLAREVVLSKDKGLIRDQNYSMRLYSPQALKALLEQVGFKNIGVKTDFSPHRSKGDYGFMNRRMIATGQKC